MSQEVLTRGADYESLSFLVTVPQSPGEEPQSLVGVRSHVVLCGGTGIFRSYVLLDTLYRAT